MKKFAYERGIEMDYAALEVMAHPARYYEIDYTDDSEIRKDVQRARIKRQFANAQERGNGNNLGRRVGMLCDPAAS